MKKLYQVLVVIDDFADTPQLHKPHGALDTLFIRGRHMQISTWVSSQKLRLISAAVRVNMQFLCCWRLRNQHELDAVIEELSALLPKEQLYRLYEQATREPYSFLFVYYLKPRNEMFFKRFEERFALEREADGSGAQLPGPEAVRQRNKKKDVVDIAHVVDLWLDLSRQQDELFKFGEYKGLWAECSCRPDIVNLVDVCWSLSKVSSSLNVGYGDLKEACTVLFNKDPSLKPNAAHTAPKAAAFVADKLVVVQKHFRSVSLNKGWDHKLAKLMEKAREVEQICGLPQKAE